MLSNKLHCTMLPVFLHWIYNAPKVITDRNFKFKICLDQVLRNMGERPWTMTSGKPRLNKNTLKSVFKEKREESHIHGLIYIYIRRISGFASNYCICCFRSSRPEVFCKKDVLRNFAKFTGKHLCPSLS